MALPGGTPLAGEMGALDASALPAHSEHHSVSLWLTSARTVLLSQALRFGLSPRGLGSALHFKVHDLNRIVEVPSAMKGHKV